MRTARVLLTAAIFLAGAGVAILRHRTLIAARDQKRLAAAREGAAKFERRQLVGRELRNAGSAAQPLDFALRTPPSSVFLPNEEKLHALAVPGTRAVRVGDKVIQLVELRGWLRFIDSACKASDPAWYYLLEPDLAWSDTVGLRPSDILRVGNIAGLGDRRGGTSPWQIESRPLIRIEFGGWDEQKLRGSPPEDWRARGAFGCPNVSFAFDPLHPVPGGPRLAPGQYIRVVGSLVTDAPHATKATAGVWLVRNFGLAVDPEHVIHACESAWSEGGEENPGNPARWTEIHPPDLIKPLPAQEPSEAVIGVAISGPDAALSGPAEPMEFSLAPPGPRPAWARGIRVVETILHACRESAFARCLAACHLAEYKNLISVRIDPESASADRFAAIFRVSWSPEADSWLVERPANARDPSSHPKPVGL